MAVLLQSQGNVTFRAGIGNRQDVGTVLLRDLTINPGINNVSISGRLQQFPIFSVLSTRPSCETGMVQFDLNGNNVTHADREIPYLSEAVQGLSLSLAVDMKAAVQESMGFEPSCLL